MNYLTETLKAKYILKNPGKYFGIKDPICKSSWEYKVFYMMDSHPNITQWGYECLEVPYFNPVKGKYTLYYPDIYCHVKQTNGLDKQFLIEIKPYKMTIEPKAPNLPKQKTSQALLKYEKALRRYQKDKANLEVNKSKWNQAQLWCNRHNINFIILTEKMETSLIS